MSLELRALSCQFGRLAAVQNVSLTLRQGSITALCGPSGAGKTTLLRMVCGLLPPQGGAVFLDGAPLNHVPPQQRGIAFVAQDSPAFPHLTVERNIRFPLEQLRLPVPESERRIQAVLADLRISHLAGQLPDVISSGERARLALARALVRQPKVLLLDEPLANLERDLCRTFRRDIVRACRAIGTTVLWVTHHLEDAQAVADEIALMVAGQIQQCASPRILYARPANSTVAKHSGQWGMNLVAGELTEAETAARSGADSGDETATQTWADRAFPLRFVGPPGIAVRLPAIAGPLPRSVLLGFRPEHAMWLGDPSIYATLSQNAPQSSVAGGPEFHGLLLPAQVDAVDAQFQGDRELVRLELPHGPIFLMTPSAAGNPWEHGLENDSFRPRQAWYPVERLSLFSAEPGGRRLFP